MPSARFDGAHIASRARSTTGIRSFVARSGRVLAQTRVEGIVTGFLGDGRVVIGILDEDGYPNMSIREIIHRSG